MMFQNSSGAYIFVGPSGPVPVEVAEHPRVIVLPPIRRGDVLRLLDKAPKVIGIVDGYFGHQPTVLHKEILEALDRGIVVLGAASMGALRAAELSHYGMRGIGRVYKGYVAGHLVGDDEVAVMHAPAELDYQLTAFALVDLRATMKAAVARGCITSTSAVRVIRIARDLNIAERTKPNLLRALTTKEWSERKTKIIEEVIAERWVNQKQRDAVELSREVLRELERPRTNPRRPPCASPNSMDQTSWIMLHRLHYCTPRDDGVSDRDLLTIAKLFLSDYPTIHRQTLLDLLLAQDIESAMVSASQEEVLSEWFAKRGGTPDDLDHWLHRRGLNKSDLVHWATVNCAASLCRERYYARFPPAVPGDAERACLLARLRGDSGILDANETASYTPEQLAAVDLNGVFRLRTPLGGLPATLLVTAIKISKSVDELYTLAKTIVDMNTSIQENHFSFNPQILGTEFVLEDFLKQAKLSYDCLDSYMLKRGFEDIEDLLYALRLSFAYRRRAMTARLQVPAELNTDGGEGI